MNPALVNGPNGYAPSFDLGGAMEWDKKDFYINVVVMDVGENEDGFNSTFYGGEFGYNARFGFGEGTYRFIYQGANESYLSADPTATNHEDRNVVFISIDQQFGENWGAWVRFGWGTDEARVSATNLYSGGINLKGGRWGRAQDNIGLGYAFFDGGNDGTKRASVGEAYYRWLMSDVFALTFDLQYQENRYDTPADGTDVDGFTYGLRGVVEF
jgi:porin